MKTVDILEVFVDAIDKTIGEKWKHEVHILGWSSEHINFEVDGKEYVIAISEVCEGDHRYQKLKETERGVNAV